MDLFSAAHSFADFSYSVQIFNRRAQILFIDPTVNHFEQIIFIPHGVFVICSDDHVCENFSYIQFNTSRFQNITRWRYCFASSFSFVPYMENSSGYS